MRRFVLHIWEAASVPWRVDRLGFARAVEGISLDCLRWFVLSVRDAGWARRRFLTAKVGFSQALRFALNLNSYCL
jgi:hypothetical protein